MSFFSHYSRLLHKHPFLINSISTGFLFGSGDALAQLFFPPDTKYSNPDIDIHIMDQKSVFASRVSNYDYIRTARAIFYGSVIFAPIGDRWYKTLPNFKFPIAFKSENASKIANTLTRVSVDQLVFAPLGIPLYYTAMSILESNPLADIPNKLKKNWWVTLKTNWLVWPVFQFGNFWLVPVEHRLLSVNCVSIVWNCYLSLRNSKGLDDHAAHLPPVLE